MTVLRSGVSSMVNSAHPSTQYGSAATLLVSLGVGQAFVQFGLPSDLRKGATVSSATLRMTQPATWTGTHTLLARRVLSKWAVSKLTWNNKPNATAGVSVTQSGSGTVWSWNVAADVQAWVDGTSPNYGWLISSGDSTASTRYLYGFAASKGKPTLEITYSYAPTAPTSLHPSAGAVSVAKPVLQFDAGDISAVQVQVDPAANATAPALDSGMVATTQTQLDLSTTSYAGLASGASTQWRVRVTDDAGRVSPWSQWVTFSRVPKPAVTITQPVATVWESTPPIMWNSAGQVAYRVLVARAATPTTYVYDTGKIASDTDQALTPSKPVFTKDGDSYVVTVRTWDAVDREATVGDPNYSEASVTTVLNYDPAVAGNTWLDASQKSVAPWVDLTWSRPVMPDGWTVLRDEEVIYVADTAADLLVSGNVYNIVDWTASPHREHVYRVAPIVNGKASKAGPSETITPGSRGIWLADPATDTAVVVWGDDSGTWAMPEDATIYTPIGASAPVRVTSSMRGLEGTLTGVLENVSDAEDYDVDAMEAALWDIKESPANVYRLVVGDLNIPVNVYEVTMMPDRLTRVGQRLVNVSFGFTQTGELPFSADL